MYFWEPRNVKNSRSGIMFPKPSLNIRPQEIVVRPNMQWEDGVYSLEDILKKYPLPLVVQCAYTLKDDISRENFDFLQPLLLYQKRVCNKVTATSLNTDPQTGHTVEVGNPLLIPEDYKGWFAVTLKPHVEPVPHYCQVRTLASSNCDTILIGGERDVNALQVYKEGDLPQPRVLYPGDVLKVGNVHVTTTKVKKKMFMKSVSKEEKFLRCTDYADREVLLPFDATGVFYPLKQKNGKTEIPIMLVKDIIADVELPCMVKLVYGRFPVTPCIFTGVMKLEECHKEPSVILSSVFNLKNILLEIPVTIPLMFRVAKNDSLLVGSGGYNNALRQCREDMETYMRNIKVSQGETTGVQTPNKSKPPFPKVPFSAHSKTTTASIPPEVPRSHACGRTYHGQSETTESLPSVDLYSTGRSSSSSSVLASSRRGGEYIPVWIGPQRPTTSASEHSGNSHLQITKQNSLTISTRNGYMTVPMYPCNPEVTDRDQVMSLVDKINLWQRMNTLDHNDFSTDSEHSASIIGRKASFTYSETGEVKDWDDTMRCRDTANGITYKNIQILR